MSSITRQKFLQIEEDILKEYKIEKYQIKYLFHALHEKKPQYELIRFLKKDNKPRRTHQNQMINENDQDFDNDDDENGNDQNDDCSDEYDDYDRDQYDDYDDDEEEDEEDNYDDDYHYYPYRYYDYGERRQKRDNRPTTNICLQIEVYDNIEKMNKFIQIYLLNTAKASLKADLEEKIKRIKTFGQTDIIMNPIDCYILQSELSKLYIDDDFYVIEYEMFDLTFREFCQTFNIDSSQVKGLLEQQSRHCQDISQISMNQSDPLNNIDKYYIKIENSRKIKLQLNLIHFDTHIHDDPQKKSLNKLKQNNKLEKEEMLDESSLNNKQMTDKPTTRENKSKKSLIQQYVVHLKNTNFKDLINQLSTQINIEDLTVKLSANVSNQFNNHDPEIIQIIAQYPKYSSFEILVINDNSFTFKVQKKDGSCCFLEGKKYKSVKEAEIIEKQYQSLIDSTTFGNEFTTIQSVQLFMLSKETYLLFEKKERMSIMNKTYRNLSDYIQSIEKYNKHFHSRESSVFSYSILEKILNFSYNLFTNCSISMHSISPQQIYIKQSSDKDQKQEKETKLLIDNLSIGDNFIVEYYQLFKHILENTHYLNAIYTYLLDIIVRFFEEISLKNVESIQQLFTQSIQKIFKNTKQILSLEDIFSQKLKSNQIKIQFSDQYLRKMNLFIDSHERSDLVICHQDLLRNYQFNYIDLKFNVKSIHNIRLSLSFNSKHYSKKYEKIQYHQNQVPRVSDKDLINILGTQQKNIIYQYFNQQQYNQARLRMTSALIALRKAISLEITLEIKECSINIQQLTLMWSDEKEFQFDANNDKFMDCKQCLQLTLKSSNEKYSLKFIKTQNSCIALLSDSPLIGAYQQYMNDMGLLLILKQADLYKNLQKTYKDQFQINHCCQFIEQFDIQLLPLQNQKSLSGLKLSFSVHQYSPCQTFNGLLNQHQSLKHLELNISEKSERYSNFYLNNMMDEEKQKQKQFYTYLRRVFITFKQLHHLKLSFKRIDEQQIKRQMYKLNKLVRLDLQERY